MTAPFDQDDEPTGMFVPTWDDEDEDVERVDDAHDVEAIDAGGDAGDPEVTAETAPEPEQEAAWAPEPEPEAAWAPDPEPEAAWAPDPEPEAASEAVWTPAEPVRASEPEPELEPEDTLEAPGAEGAGSWFPARDAEETVEAVPVAPSRTSQREETDPGTLRPLVPEPVVEARRARPAPVASAPSRAGRTGEALKATGGLLVLVVVAGVGLAAAIGVVVLVIAFALQRLAGS